MDIIVQFHASTALSSEKDPKYPMTRRLGEFSLIPNIISYFVHPNHSAFLQPSEPCGPPKRRHVCGSHHHLHISTEIKTVISWLHWLWNTTLLHTLSTLISPNFDENTKSWRFPRRVEHLQNVCLLRLPVTESKGSRNTATEQRVDVSEINFF
jgi:hypothetical protein